MYRWALADPAIVDTTVIVIAQPPETLDFNAAPPSVRCNSAAELTATDVAFATAAKPRGQPCAEHQHQAPGGGAALDASGGDSCTLTAQRCSLARRGGGGTSRRRGIGRNRAADSAPSQWPSRSTRGRAARCRGADDSAANPACLSGRSCSTAAVVPPDGEEAVTVPPTGWPRIRGWLRRRRLRRQQAVVVPPLAPSIHRSAPPAAVVRPVTVVPPWALSIHRSTAGSSVPPVTSRAAGAARRAPAPPVAGVPPWAGLRRSI